MRTAEIETTILVLLDECAEGKTLCPSEVARYLAGEQHGAWRALMPDIRRAADGLVAMGRLRVTQRGNAVSAVGAVGPVRLGRP